MKARRSDPPKKTKEPAKAVEIAASLGSPFVRLLLGIAGGLYIAGVFIEGSGGHLDRLVYRPVLFFAQIAALFPRAATHQIEYRAEGQTCDGRTIEVDVRPFFPIHANDKENRFDRAMHFYREDRPTMAALETYVMDRYNASARDEANREDRSKDEKIGGVVFLSLRVPLPSPGGAFPRYQRRPLADYPKEQRKVWYTTPKDAVSRHCSGGGA